MIHLKQAYANLIKIIKQLFFSPDLNVQINQSPIHLLLYIYYHVLLKSARIIPYKREFTELGV